MAYLAGEHALQKDMCKRRLLSWLLVDVSGSLFLFLNVAVFVWLICVIIVIGVPFSTLQQNCKLSSTIV